MYNELDTPYTPRAHGAHEITLQVRESERRFALLRNLDSEDNQSGRENVLRRAARRIVTVMSSLF